MLSGLHLRNTYEYDAAGNKTRESVLSGTSVQSSTDYRFNEFNQLISSVKKDEEGSVASSKAYTYDLNGNQTTEIDSITGEEADYKYDADNRLSEATGRNGYRAYKACKYARKARSYVKKGKALKKIKLKARHTKITKKKYKVKRKPKVVRTSKKTIKKLQRKAKARCFTAGTRIHTEKGFKAIETIKPGDRVWSENPETNSKALKKVKKIFVREKDSLIRLAINGEVIETTDEHPFYVEGRGFTAAKELKAGDEVRLEDGTAARIESSETRQLDRPVKVYNFEVEDYHTYYVSEQKVLVHNTCMETVKNTPRLVKTSYKKANYVGKVKSKNGESPDDFSLPNAGRRGAFREAKRASGLPVSSNPISVRPAIGKNGKTIPGRDYVFEHPQEANKELVVREHFGHNYPDNPMQNRGKHFNDIYGNHYDY